MSSNATPSGLSPAASDLSPSVVPLTSGPYDPAVISAFLYGVMQVVKTTTATEATTGEVVAATEAALLEPDFITVIAKAVKARVEKARATAEAEAAEQALAALAAMPQTVDKSMLPEDVWDVVIRFLSSEGHTHTIKCMIFAFTSLRHLAINKTYNNHNKLIPTNATTLSYAQICPVLGTQTRVSTHWQAVMNCGGCAVLVASLSCLASANA